MFNDEIDDIDDYKWFGINRTCRINARRGAGGVGFLIKKSLAHHVKPIVTDIEDMYMIAIGELELCLVYVQPQKSLSKPNPRSQQIWDRVENERTKCTKNKFLLIGDMNARVGIEQDWIKVDEIDSESDDEVTPSRYTDRSSDDTTTNHPGKRLLQYCKDFDDRILNGRFGTAKHTFTGHYGKSVIDLIVANKHAHEACHLLQVHQDLMTSPKYSGHYPVSIEIKDVNLSQMINPEIQREKRIDYTKTDWNKEFVRDIP
eukprot:Lithocolla_globosa_v1_NODE_622_length_3578_cov_109.881067.p2 type:complete len:259 gc:universal NODE_622_length_3578_cov_109.881067:126-902(+)